MAPLDFARIEFPSDKLTVGQVRRLHGDRIDRETPTFFDAEPYCGSAAFALGNMLGMERALAAYAYNRAAGEAWKEVSPGFDRDTLAGDLAEDYVRYGLAAGEKSAALLVRRFEARAAGQALGR